MLTVPQQLKKIQKNTGLTQAALAVRLGVTFAALNRWMNGRAQPRADALKRIEELYSAPTTPTQNAAWEYDAAAYAIQAASDIRWDLERKINYGLPGTERLSAQQLASTLPNLQIAPERRAFLGLILGD